MSREHKSNIEIETRPLTSHSTRAGGRSYVQISVYLNYCMALRNIQDAKEMQIENGIKFLDLLGILQCFIPAL